MIGQANNVFIFPGVGLGAIVAGATELPDEVFLVAARRLAGLVTRERVRDGALYPRIAELRSVARDVAIAVAGYLGATRSTASDEASVCASVDRAMWWPEYVRLVPG